VEGGLNRVDGEAQRAVAVHLALRREAEARDGGRATQRVSGHPVDLPRGAPGAQATPTQDCVLGREWDARVWRPVARARGVPRPAKPARQTRNARTHDPPAGHPRVLVRLWLRVELQ